MGSVIHMETDQVQAVAKQLSQASTDIQQEIISIGNRLRGLNWQSPSRDQFIKDVDDLQRKIQTYAEQGSELGVRVQREVEEWEQAAMSLVAGGLTVEQQRARIINDTRQSIQKKWDEMSFDERKKWLDEWYKNLCKKLGMPPVDFKVEDLEDPEGADALGAFVPGTIFGLFRSMTVDIDNVKDNDPFEILDTVAHETRHQYQQYLVEHPDQRPPDISEEQIQTWKENIDNYIRYEDDPQGYWDQSIEVDARQAGEKALNDYVESGGKTI